MDTRQEQVFPGRLRARRRWTGLTQDALASRVNKSRVAIVGYESGRRSPDKGTLALIAAALMTTTDYLLGLTDDPSPSQVREGTPAWLVGENPTPEEREHLRRYLAWIRHEKAERQKERRKRKGPSHSETPQS